MLENDIKILIKILEESNIDELEVSTFWNKQKICIRKSRSQFDGHSVDANQNVSMLDNIVRAESIKTKPDEDILAEPVKNSKESDIEMPTENYITIKAPLVGTFYKSPKPDTPPFISEGDDIKQGQILCVIEAMKIFNEIESEYSGKVIKILIDDATPVEYDQDLLVISPD